MHSVRWWIVPPILLATLSAPVATARLPRTSQTICSAVSDDISDCPRANQIESTPIASSSHVISIWGGARETIALKSDGAVWTWGLNACTLGSGGCGKLGDGTQTSSSLLIQVHGPGNVGYLTSITAIMGGEHANYALKSDGTVWAWGGNFVGQLGDGTYTNTVIPVQVSGLTAVRSLGGRGCHSLAIQMDRA